jgi:hypothetical protein
VKTRTLLLLAVACGLAILVAGSIKVFLIADDKPPPHLAVGQSGTIGDMTVTVQSVRQAGTQTLIGVRLGGTVDPDGGLSFVYGTGGRQLQPEAPAAGDPPCGATAVEPADCVLAFATLDIPGVLRYQRADETLRWDITAVSAG